MFSIITIFVCLVLMPFLLAPTIGFHKIKESHRYLVSGNRLPASEGEALALKIIMGILTLLLFMGDYMAADIVGGLGLIIIMFASLLAFYYLVKIGRSFLSGNRINVLGNITLETKAAKILLILFILILFLTILENFHVIPTYLK